MGTTTFDERVKSAARRRGRRESRSVSASRTALRAGNYGVCLAITRVSQRDYSDVVLFDQIDGCRDVHGGPRSGPARALQVPPAGLDRLGGAPRWLLDSPPARRHRPDGRAVQLSLLAATRRHWTDEYDTRKRHQPLYHIQEYMLTEYMMQHAPAKVLEFGCGVGRHLRNLAASPASTFTATTRAPPWSQGCLSWTEQAWIDAHVTVGEPTGSLPYADKAFDIVYTAEVLVHVRPEDLEGILRELLRVCRGHVLHLETSPDCEISPTSHEGCWKHDLVATYARLGRACEVLPRGYRVHTPYRVVVGEPAPVSRGLSRSWPCAVRWSSTSKRLRWSCISGLARSRRRRRDRVCRRPNCAPAWSRNSTMKVATTTGSWQSNVTDFTKEVMGAR